MRVLYMQATGQHLAPLRLPLAHRSSPNPHPQLPRTRSRSTTLPHHLRPHTPRERVALTNTDTPDLCVWCVRRRRGGRVYCSSSCKLQLARVQQPQQRAWQCASLGRWFTSRPSSKMLSALVAPHLAAGLAPRPPLQHDAGVASTSRPHQPLHAGLRGHRSAAAAGGWWWWAGGGAAFVRTFCCFCVWRIVLEAPCGPWPSPRLVCGAAHLCCPLSCQRRAGLFIVLAAPP